MFVSYYFPFRKHSFCSFVIHHLTCWWPFNKVPSFCLQAFQNSSLRSRIIRKKTVIYMFLFQVRMFSSWLNTSFAGFTQSEPCGWRSSWLNKLSLWVNEDLPVVCVSSGPMQFVFPPPCLDVCSTPCLKFCAQHVSPPVFFPAGAQWLLLFSFAEMVSSETVRFYRGEKLPAQVLRLTVALDEEINLVT